MSGTFTSTIASYLFLDLDWEVLSQDITNNRSRVRLTLKLRHTGTGIWFSAPKSGVLQGSSFSYTGGFSGSGTRTLQTRDIWINHNSDGSKSQNISGSFNVAISYQGTHRGNTSVSGNITLSTIPRASTLSAFSFNAHLKNGVANRINYTVDRKSGNFRHQIQLRDGNTTLWTWDNQNTDGSNNITLTASRVNTLLNRMSNSTTRSLTLRVRTRSGSGGSWIGSAVTRNATATVHADVKPTVGSLSLSQIGNSVTSHYLQGKSKVKASFTRSAGYGASISSSSITVRRKSTNNDVQTINSNDGTTSRAVSLSGAYEARGMARDSRGRTTYTSWTDFSVTAYSAPRITEFTADRSSSTPTTVNISRAGTHTPLGGSNPLTYTVQRRLGTGSWSNVNTRATGTSTTASFSGTSISTSNSVTSSYDFRMVITDKFGERAESIISVSTQRVVLDIHKNEGVGIGKVHEQGVLDVDGSAFFSGSVDVVGHLTSDRIELNSGKADTPALWIKGNAGDHALRTRGIDGANSNGTLGDLYINYQSDGKVFIGSDQSEIVGMGTNSDGTWVRFYSGLQICYDHNFTRKNNLSNAYENTGLYRAGSVVWTYPRNFMNSNVSTFAQTDDWFHWCTTFDVSATTCRVIEWGAVHHESGQNKQMLAIGRWK